MDEIIAKLENSRVRDTQDQMKCGTDRELRYEKMKADAELKRKKEELKKEKIKQIEGWNNGQIGIFKEKQKNTDELMRESNEQTQQVIKIMKTGSNLATETFHKDLVAKLCSELEYFSKYGAPISDHIDVLKEQRKKKQKIEDVRMTTLLRTDSTQYKDVMTSIEKSKNVIVDNAKALERKKESILTQLRSFEQHLPKFLIGNTKELKKLISETKIALMVIPKVTTSLKNSASRDCGEFDDEKIKDLETFLKEIDYIV